MASTAQIIEAARKLGELISDHDVAKKAEAAADRLSDDNDAQRALNDYNRHLKTLSEKEVAGRPIEVEDKRQLEKLQNAVVHNALLRDLQTTQMDYADLLRQVDDALTGRAPRPAGSPGTAADPAAGAVS